MIRDLIARATRWLTSPAPPVACAVCKRPSAAWRRPAVGELMIGGTCSEECALWVLNIHRRRFVPTRSSPPPASLDTVCPGPLCALCNGEACQLCLPGGPCPHNIGERHTGVPTRAAVLAAAARTGAS